ncbi:MAG: hypothetical protein AAF108_04170 [Planctomycetota bacterium]
MIQDIGALLVSHPGPGFLGGLPLEDVNGRPLVERLLQQLRGWDRVRRSRVDRHRSLHGAIALAASIDPSDDPLCDWANSIDLPYVRSSSGELAERVAEGAELAGFTWVAPIDPRDAIVDIRGFELASTFAQVGIDLVTNRDALGIAAWPVEIVRTSSIDTHSIGSITADGLWGTDLEKCADVPATDSHVDVRVRSREDLQRLRAFAESEVTDWTTMTASTVSRWFGDQEFASLRAAA